MRQPWHDDPHPYPGKVYATDAPDDVPDSAEIDALSELERHPGYVLVRTRIEEVIELRRDALEKDGKVRFHQGYITGLRMVLELPEILRGEIIRIIEEEQHVEVESR